MTAPEPFLQVRRHVSCCGMTWFSDRYPTGERETDEAASEQQFVDAETWAIQHRKTCRALKADDDSTQ